VVELPARFFLTGTDTDAGKTVAAAALCAARGYDYFKPVQAGLPADSAFVARMTTARVWPERWRLAAAKSPHRAATEPLDLSTVALPPAERLLVEGAGGWCVPYGPGLSTVDLVRHLGLPVVVVCRTGLGTLNHTTLTVRAIRADGVDVVGLVAVGPPHPENLADLPGLTGAPLIAWLPWVDDLERDFGQLVAAARQDTELRSDRAAR